MMLIRMGHLIQEEDGYTMFVNSEAPKDAKMRPEKVQIVDNNLLPLDFHRN